MCAVKIVPAKKLTIDTAIKRTIDESANGDWDDDRDPPMLRLEGILRFRVDGGNFVIREGRNNMVYRRSREASATMRSDLVIFLLLGELDL